MDNAFFDIAFIGSGLSCTYTLAHFIRMIERDVPYRKINLLIIEKNSEFWTGIPYGGRSGKNSLIITPLNQFIPENERLFFLHWLAINKKQILKDLKEQDDILTAEWLESNEKFLSKNQWDNIYIPRFLFGAFLTERIYQLLKGAVNSGLIQYKLLSAEVKSVNKYNDFYQISTCPGEVESIYNSKKIVLAVGSPHKDNLLDELPYHPAYIKDLYHPSLNENLINIWNILKNTADKRKNILVIGSNASALEVLYNLRNNGNIIESINQIYILSPNGAFPGRISIGGVRYDFSPHYLTVLGNRASFTARQILTALKKDLKEAAKAKILAADTVYSVSKIIISLLNKLDLAEQKKFIDKYGIEIGKLQRRAGAAYCNAASEFKAQNKLEFIKGKFIGYSLKKDLFEVKYYDISSDKEEIFREPMAVIVNCSGFQSLSKPPSLLKGLIKQKICKVNNSKRGIEVNENFEASKNFYVMGPLLAGNLNKNLRVWHAESCPRIFSLSQQLAEVLAGEYQTETQAEAPVFV